MLIGGVVFGLLAGLALGGRLEHLATVRLRFLPLLFFAVILRFGTEASIAAGVAITDQLRLPLFLAAYGLLLFTLWRNRSYPGLALAFIGIASNALAILINGGRMPVWEQSFVQAGFGPGDLSSVFHVLVSGTGPDFFLHAGPLGDVIPIPIDPVRNVASIGDLFLTAGLAFFLFATLMRRPYESPTTVDEDLVARRLALIRASRLPGHEPGPAGLGEDVGIRQGTGLTAGLSDAAALDRPLMMGAGGIGMASPATASREMDAGGAAGGALALSPTDLLALPGAITLPRRRWTFDRVREHPYIRLALNGSFSALWTGQVISLFGDRVNQIALAAFVYTTTNSALAVALTFLVGTLPNLLFSPIAGTFVDRWDQKQVLVVSDLLRAALVLLVPVAVLMNVWLAYPLVFLITTVSLFFRPARVAVLPRLVREDDLLAANSALWVGETFADVINYPLAGLFVVFLANSLPVAFWFDAATYLASAALIASIVVPPVVRRLVGRDATEGEEGQPSVRADLVAGWAFLRQETVLLANTLQGAAGQFAAGIVTVASPILAAEVLSPNGDEWRATYAFMETSIGLGNLLGGFALGLVASRVRKGRLVIAAYTVFGVLVVLLGIVPSLPVVLGLLAGIGVANMAFVIPSQTLFQERTPPELMGRVVSFRFALVFGAMSVAMALGGLFADVLGPGAVIAMGGVVSIAAGLGGLGVRALRDA